MAIYCPCVSLLHYQNTKQDLNHQVEYYLPYIKKMYVMQVWPHSSHEDLKQENVYTTTSQTHMVRDINQ